jgi:hypothetical protein
VRYFLIDNVQQRMAVDNQVYPVSTSMLAANVAHIAYDVGGSNGGIEYNDRPTLTTPFTDPTPYQGYLNSWINLAAADTPPLSVAAAQSIKQALMTAIYNSKRAAVTASYGGYSWACDDLDFTNDIAAAVVALLGVPPMSAIPPPPVQPLPIGAQAVVHAGYVPSNTQVLVATTNGIVAGQTLIDLTYAVPSQTVTGTGSGSWGPFVNFTPGDAHFNNAAFSDQLMFWTAPPAWTPPTPPPPASGTFTPISGPAQTYNATQMIALINAIMAARAAFQANYNSKTTALAATVTIAAVVAFDVTTGW